MSNYTKAKQIITSSAPKIYSQEKLLCDKLFSSSLQMTNLHTDEMVFFRNLTKNWYIVLTKIKHLTVSHVLVSILNRGSSTHTCITPGKHIQEVLAPRPPDRHWQENSFSALDKVYPWPLWILGSKGQGQIWRRIRFLKVCRQADSTVFWHCIELRVKVKKKRVWILLLWGIHLVRTVYVKSFAFGVQVLIHSACNYGVGMSFTCEKNKLIIKRGS